MKRLFVILCAIMCTMSLSAQLLFYPITEVRADSNGMDFQVKAGEQPFLVSKFDYQQIVAAPQDFLLVLYIGEEASTITVARKSACQYVVSEVLSVEPAEGGKWLLKLTSGLQYTSSNQGWGKVQVGQHVSYAIIDGETKQIIRRPHTVSRDVAVTDQLPISQAPSAPVLVLDEHNRIVGINL